MPAPIEILTNWRDHRIDEIIDVRSPAEFADDHIPGAINLPVFQMMSAPISGPYINKKAPLSRAEKALLFIFQCRKTYSHKH